MTRKQCTHPGCSYPAWSGGKCRSHDAKDNPEKYRVKRSKSKPKPVSEKRKVLNTVYNKMRKEFLARPENKYCFIDGCSARANTIEHAMKRDGYADQWARDNNIPLLIDERYWKPCCSDHNLELERNPELSKKYQLSKHTGKPRD